MVLFYATTLLNASPTARQKLKNLMADNAELDLC